MAAKKPVSKFKFVAGNQEPQLSECWGSVRVGMCSSDSCVIKANAQFFAIPWAVSSSIAVHPLAEKGSIPDERPLIRYEDSGTVQDLDFSPFHDGILASGWEDGTIRIHRIDCPGATTASLAIEPQWCSPAGDSKRCLLVAWHPCAAHVLLSADSGKAVRLWDVTQGAERDAVALPAHAGVIVNAAWCAGSATLFATAAKDKVVRVVDTRAGAVVAEAKSHQGSKGGRVAWLSRLNRLFTVGFNKTNAREAALLDPRNLAAPVATVPTIDAQPSTSTLLPFVDEDLGLVYLAGKGETSMRIVEATEGTLAAVADWKHKDPQSSVAMLPKTVVDTSKCEIARFVRLIETKHLAAPVRFEVPRQAGAQIFQDDLYPDTWDGQPSCTAADFVAGTCHPRNTRPFPRK